MKNAFSIKGTLNAHSDIPGDKSISHRALILSAFASSKSQIKGLNQGLDLLKTRQALESIGCYFQDEGPELISYGYPPILQSPSSSIFLGNSGTSARLLTGVFSALPVMLTLTGDASLSQRPMDRVVIPLQLMGAKIQAATGKFLPIKIKGAPLNPIRYEIPVPSAQLKSALLLAGMLTKGTTKIIEEVPTRDHTERLMSYFGIPLTIKDKEISISGLAPYQGKHIFIPGDPSAAAFFVVAALITPHSHLFLKGISWNPLRNQVFTVLQQMGGKIHVTNPRIVCGEPVADIEVFSSTLYGIETLSSQAPQLIDEFPILSIAAACAQGESIFRGLGELRFKESDRLHAIHYNLSQCGYVVRIQGDDLYILGQSNRPKHNLKIDTFGDHRIAMSFEIFGLLHPGRMKIDSKEMIQTSFPSFYQCLEHLKISPSR
jgi:3-phosphoshikimate 1-carboxyvinyltransferase